MALIRQNLSNPIQAIDALNQVNWQNNTYKFYNDQLIKSIEINYFDFLKVDNLISKPIVYTEFPSDFDQLMYFVNTAIYYFKSNNYKESLTYFEKGKESILKDQNISKKLNSQIKYQEYIHNLNYTDSLLQDIYWHIALCNFEEKKYNEANNYCQKIINIEKNKLLTQYQFKAYQLLANIYLQEENYTDAENALNNCLKFSKSIDKQEINTTYLYLAKVYFLQTKYTRSLNLIDELIDSGNLDAKNKMIAYYLKYELFLVQSDYANAQKNYQLYQANKSLFQEFKEVYYKEQKSKAIEAQILENNIQTTVKEEIKQDLLLKNIQNESERKDIELKLLAQEFELKEKEANFQKLEKERIENELKILNQKLNIEKLNNQNKTLEKNALAEKLNSEKKEKELQAAKNKEIISQKEIEIKENQILNEKKAKSYLIYGLSTSIFLLIIALILFFINIKRNKEIKVKNNQLNEANKEINFNLSLIETKNKLITESIEYAKSIQNSILPYPRFLNSCFKEHFVIFKPKDIVSGDIYFVLEKDNILYVSVIDCSGHGVSGAMLSSVAVQQLEIQINKHTTNLVAILNELQEYFLNNLNGGEDIETNGMDLILLAIDKSNLKMKYAGARSSFYIYSNKTLEKFNSTKLSIGQKNRTNVEFIEYTYSLKENDVVYLCTDGLIDQFDAETGKRIGSKNFETLLNDLATYDLNEQHKKLINFIDNICKTDQTDDITVFSFKL